MRAVRISLLDGRWCGYVVVAQKYKYHDSCAGSRQVKNICLKSYSYYCRTTDCVLVADSVRLPAFRPKLVPTAKGAWGGVGVYEPFATSGAMCVCASDHDRLRRCTTYVSCSWLLLIRRSIHMPTCSFIVLTIPRPSYVPGTG